MIQKLKSKKGFTLAELLIVIAIIGVLVAIAIPVFSSQLDNAKAAVDDANLRSATSMAIVDFMTTYPDGNGGEVSYHAFQKTVGETTNIKVTTATALDGYTECKGSLSTNKIMNISIGTGGTVVTSKWTS